MIPRLATNLLLTPKDVPASSPAFEVIGVFNPAVVRANGEVVLLARIAERPSERRPGYIALPRWDAEKGTTVDWVREADFDLIDARVVRHKTSGLLRLTFISHLRLILCGDGRAVKKVSTTTFAPSSTIEEYGVEDSRVTPLDGRFFITYVAVSRHGPATCLAVTTDFREFERLGVIFCPENKDVVLFPERIGEELVALHRPVGKAEFCRPEMWLAHSPDLIHWGRHAPIRLEEQPWRSGRVGAGAPPIRVDDGWLVLYHGNRRPESPGDVGAYCAGALLLDPEDPSRVLRQSPGPLFQPELDFETAGFVPDVVFPTGVVDDGDNLLVYYGAADTSIAMVEFSTRELLAEMITEA